LARRSLEHVYKAAEIKRNGNKLHIHTHMLRHTFAIEKLNAGASLEDVSLLLAHHSIKITERHYLKFDPAAPGTADACRDGGLWSGTNPATQSNEGAKLPASVPPNRSMSKLTRESC